MVVIPEGGDHQITYKLTDLRTFRTIAELPLNQMTFTKVVNGVGPWEASLNVEDREVRKSNWIAATAVYRTAMWVDIDGTLIYGGIVSARKYTLSTGRVSLSGFDFCGYLSQLLQAANYSTLWAELPGVGAPLVAYTLIADALAKAGAIPIKLTKATEPEKAFWITFAAPEAQQQSVMSVLSQLQELGFMVGVDYACDVEYVAGIPTPTITLSYPRRGKTALREISTIDIANALEFEYDEDGSQQANSIVEQAGATIDRSSNGEWAPAVAAGYPLLEACLSHPALAPTEASSTVLEAYTAGDLTVMAFPLTVPVVTLPLFGTPSIFDLAAGDNAVLRVTKGAGDLILNNPRFPVGLEHTYRMESIAVTIPDEGVPTMVVSLNEPPSTTPVEPPETIGPGPGNEKEKWVEEEEERTNEKEEVEAIAKEAIEIAEEAKEKAITEGLKELTEEIIEEAERAKTKSEAENAKSNAESAKTRAEEEVVESKTYLITSFYEQQGADPLGAFFHFAGPVYTVGQKATGTFPKLPEIEDIQNLLGEKISSLNITGMTLIPSGGYPRRFDTLEIKDEGSSGITAEVVEKGGVGGELPIAYEP